MIVNILTSIHVVFSLIAIGAGSNVLFGLLAGKLAEKWTVTFFRCSLAASVAGLLLFAGHLSLTQWLAMISVYMSGAAVLGWRKFHLAGVWRSICAFSTTIVLSLNFLLLTTQAFEHIPALKALAPTLSEPAFLFSQLLEMAFFVALGMVAVGRFRDNQVALLGH
ncbi:hypothetical protein [Silvibacterium dinghuense]|uniref:DUF2306 domain-containing protein n=1 Tax=Silvibacterium dinghuense TaxID=1560006 RepID=A0A4Q1SJH9_9BACT|nr:hypothetical protein [Silvibacterium dinghuense]RXS97589.1 hypothetical protein ESZ00_06805 [Silvibacterium dinghuense]GGH00285.1 membrane protein [Silvibacterium dinghuense]